MFSSLHYAHSLLHAGADYKNRYKPITTSYDYDAPLSEAGDPTAKLTAIRTVIGKVTGSSYLSCQWLNGSIILPY